MTHPLSETIRTYARESMSPHRSEHLGIAADELDRLHAIVERLPLTADGVPVVPGVEVFCALYKEGVDRIVWEGQAGEARIYTKLSGNGAWFRTDYTCPLATHCYSTRESAQAAAKEARDDASDG